MRVILFFTYGISLFEWKSSGLLEREIYFYKYLNDKFKVKFTFITFGESEDKTILNYPFIDVVPVYEYLKYDKNKYIRFIRSFMIPIKLRKKIVEGDVLKTNQLLGSWIAILSKLKYTKPLIVRTGYDLYSFSKMNKKRYFKQLFYYLLTRISLKYSDIYLVTSKADKEKLKEMSIKNYYKVKIRPNWMRIQETNVFNKRYKNKVISVGRIEEQKNFFELIDGLKNTNIEIDIYGEGSQKNKLIEYANKQKVNLKINSPVPNDVLIKKIQDYKIFISSSKFEGNPKSILEAMAAGCVVIAKKSENISELIQNSENGLLYEEPKIIENLLSIYLNNEKDWSNISINAVRHIKNLNGIEEIAENEISDYEALNISN
ncbi:MAG: hypothetical protein CMC23_05405 [Flavobacteriaceae bacterium]|nr:hypothetical protein [Flavobacteriaceae bacterium]|tara:strand:+ start:149 stop:1270 length:1122 start_codon:yes stop_codon:yes gene_type:complete